MARINSKVSVVILDMTDVQMMDMTGIVALNSLLVSLQRREVTVVMACLAPRIQQKLRKAGIVEQPGVLEYSTDLEQARRYALAIRPA